MKLGYYGYSFEDHSEEQDRLEDIDGFLKSFCEYQNNSFKAKFTYKNDHLFLFNPHDRFYLFLKTKSSELIKKVNSTEIKAEDLSDFLGEDEKLGFVSYIYVKDNYFAMASPSMAPTPQQFAIFVDQLFASINMANYTFHLHPFMHEATKADIEKLAFVGRSTFKINESTSRIDDLKTFLSGGHDDFHLVDNMQITITPIKGENIKPLVSKVLDAHDDVGLEKATIRGRAAIHDALTDYYLSAKGHIGDNLKAKTEYDIHAEIIEHISDNGLLIEKAKEHEQDSKFEKGVKAIASHNSISSWANSVDSL